MSELDAFEIKAGLKNCRDLQVWEIKSPTLIPINIQDNQTHDFALLCLASVFHHICLLGSSTC